MRLTLKQKDALNLVKEDKSISVEDDRLNNKTMNSLYNKGLLRCPRYANGEFWELSCLGEDIKNKIK